MKSRRNLKALNISAPMLADVRESSPNTPSESTSPTVILAIKFPFKAELDAELSVQAGTFVKLLERPGNGWLYVQYLDSYQARGLVPASYVDIEVNDIKNAITLDWLNATVPQSQQDQESTHLFSFATVADAQQESAPSTPALSSSSMFEPPAVAKSVLISNVLQSAVGGAWYRVDVRMSDQSMVYVAKKYQDFYNLHIALLQSTSGASTLPRLPPLIRTNKVGVMTKPQTDKAYLESLLVRCNELNYYINQLIKGHTANGMELYHWIMGTSDPRLIFANETAVNMFSDDINEKLYPNSTNVMAVLLPKPTPTASFPSSNQLAKVATTGTDVTNSTSINSLSSLLDTYELVQQDSYQDSSESSTTWEMNSAGNSTADTSADESHGDSKNTLSKPHLPHVSSTDARIRHRSSSSAESIFSATNKSSPTTPTLNYYADQISPSTPVEIHEELPDHKSSKESGAAFQTTPAAGDLIKIKVSLNNAQGDIVALRIKRTNLISVVYLKKLLSHKIYKDFNLIHHYKLVAEGEGDMDEDALLDYMKLQTKVHLTLRRVRQSSQIAGR